MDYEVGLIGGIGSDASAYFYQKLLNKTDVSCDQDHLNVVVLNHAALPDRTKSIQSGNIKPLLNKFKTDFDILNQIEVKDAIVLCNTAHKFHDYFQEYANMNVYHLIEETANWLKQHGYDDVAILATTGTVHSQTYQQYLDKAGLTHYIPDEAIQQEVMEIIYDYVKVGKKVSSEQFYHIIDHMKQKGAKTFILGCTELSILKEKMDLPAHYVDPLDIAIEYLLHKYNRKMRK